MQQGQSRMGLSYANHSMEQRQSRVGLSYVNSKGDHAAKISLKTKIKNFPRDNANDTIGTPLTVEKTTAARRDEALEKQR